MCFLIDVYIDAYEYILYGQATGLSIIIALFLDTIHFQSLDENENIEWTCDSFSYRDFDVQIGTYEYILCRQSMGLTYNMSLYIFKVSMIKNHRRHQLLFCFYRDFDAQIGTYEYILRRQSLGLTYNMSLYIFKLSMIKKIKNFINALLRFMCGCLRIHFMY